MTSQPVSTPASRQPLEMMAEQTRLLNEINANLSTLRLAQAENQRQLAALQQRLYQSRENEQEISLTRLDIGFMNMANFMVKWSLASIPAAIALAVLLGGCFLIFSAVTAALGIGAAGLR